MATLPLRFTAYYQTKHLIEAFETLEEVMPDEMLPFLDYFERTYIGRRLRARRRDPTYSHDFWNVHVRVSNGDAGTNNKVERSPQSNKENVINATPNYLKIYRSFEEIAEHKQKQD